ncbi:MAG: 4Fe-4S binding protein [Rhodospirillales bacterium]|nr:4Fe-4S binding protein [Rhodospirillales bacterium]
MVRIDVARRELHYHGGGCLPQRPPFAPCQACQDACPVSAIAVDPNEFRLSADCQACGRCAAACPTGALSIARVEPPVGWRATGPVHLECARVPASRCADPETRLPCLGALGVEALLAWVLAAKGQPVIVIDRGWCDTCPVGAPTGRHPAQAALDRAKALFGAMGLKEGLVPRRDVQLLDSKLRDDRLGGDAPTRRDLLRRLGAPAENRALAGPLAKRHRGTERLTALARRYGTGLPPLHFPSLTLDAACQAHGVCAAVCPTGALRLESEGTSRRLSFAAADCLACGRCAAQCPEAALSHVWDGNGSRSEGRIELSHRAVSACSACGRDHVAAQPLSLCPACQRRSQLGRLGLALVETGRRSPSNTVTESHFF